MPIFIGDVTSSQYYRSSTVKHIKHIREVTDLQDGDIAEFFGHVLRRDNNCVTEEICQQWRAQGDTSCDAALSLMFPKPSDSVGRDLYESLVSYTVAYPGENAATIFLNEVQQTPPLSIEVSEVEVAASRVFFLDHAVQMMQALLHYGLVGGFASALIVRTLQSASYLIPAHGVADTSKASNDRTYSRLLETFQFVLDVVNCPPFPLSQTPNHSSISNPEKVLMPDAAKAYLMPGGEGWKAIVRVRMLHGVARRRAREHLNKLGGSSSEYVPINQEEMGATLGSFCIVPLWCLRRLGLAPSPPEADAYLALWRHVGFYLGVSPAILTRYFSSTATADKYLASTVLDLFSEDEPENTNTFATIPILRAVSNRPLSHSSFEYNCAVTRYLLGPELATHLGIPPTSVWMTLKLHTTFLLYKLPVWFAHWYPRTGWAEKRREALSEAMARSVRWSLGMRHSKFRPRVGVKVDGGDRGTPGDLADGVKDLETVTPDYVGGNVLMKKWQETLGELVIVHVLVGGLVVGTAIHALRYVR